MPKFRRLDRHAGLARRAFWMDGAALGRGRHDLAVLLVRLEELSL
jgi:hypothetical protein